MQVQLEETSDEVSGFEGLVAAHANDLFRKASSLLRNREEAVDAVQECLFQAWNPSLRGELLPLIAETVEVTGSLQRSVDSLTLRVFPDRLRRVRAE